MQKYGKQKALELITKIEDSNIRRACEASLSGNTNMHQMVKTFHKVYRLPIVNPADAKENFMHMTKERLAMRFGLIVEEFKELCEAMDLGVQIQYNYLDENEVPVYTQDIVQAITNTEERNIPEVADALFDLKYVCIGFELEVGIEPDATAIEGQASNLSKLMPDGTVKRRADGKVLKGPNFFPPDMSHALRTFGMRVV